MRIKRNFIYIIVTVIYMLAILLVSLKSGSGSDVSVFKSQALNNFLHIPVYGILAYLIFRCFTALSSKICVISFSISVLYGAFIEFLQIFIPDRTASFIDIGLNAIGVLFVILHFYRQNIKRLALGVK